jgi:hypothetical protein
VHQQPQHNKGKWKPYEDNMLRESVHKHRGDNGQINWHDVKVFMEGTRSYQQCVDRWSKYLKFQEENNLSSSVNDSLQNYWSEAEDKLLSQAMQLFEYRTKKGKKTVDWTKVIDHFKGTRTYLQCYNRWYLVLHPRKLYKSGSWSTQEDNNLLAAMTPNDPPLNATATTYDTATATATATATEPVDWSNISRLLEFSRSPKQCRNRWDVLKSREGISFGRWSAEEDLELKSAIAAFNEQCTDDEENERMKIDWNKLVENLNLSRTPLQCRNRAIYYESLDNIEPWSADEDSRLEALVREFGTSGRSNGIHWEAVGKRMPNRGVCQCKTRWFEYVKLEGRRRRGAFTASEDTRLANTVATLRMSLSSSSVNETPRGFWLKVGENFGPTRSHTQCRQRWKVICDNDDGECDEDEDEYEDEDDSEEEDSDDDIVVNDGGDATRS